MVEHATFELVCLNYNVLRTAVSAVVDVTEDFFTEPLNHRLLDTSAYGSAILFVVYCLSLYRLLRLTAYRQFTDWAHKRLGRHVRMDTPSCVVFFYSFPGEGEVYVGFREHEP